MFSWLNQIAQISWMNLKSLSHRLGSSMVIVIGIAGVVAVFTGILSMSEGFQRTLGNAGSEQRAIVLRAGSNSELVSGISREQADVIAGLPGIARGADRTPLAAAELLVIAELPMQSGHGNAALRGTQPASFALRPEVKLLMGRRSTPGTRELIVGKQAERQFAGLAPGARVAIRGADWTVVGVFEAGGGIHESELWADAGTLQNAYQRSGFQSVSVALADASSLAALRTGLEGDARLQMRAETLREHYGSQSAKMSKLINVLGYSVGLIMAVGAVFGALNTMYTAISTRSREIATLRAIGFGAAAVVVSVMLEAILLGLLGGAGGALLTYLVFNGYTAATMSANFSQVAFDFQVTPGLIGRGMSFALMIALAGGSLPAWRAGRLPVATSLRTR